MRKNNIRVYCIAPTAATRMLQGLLPENQLAALHPAAVSPAVAVLVAEDAPTRTVLCAGAGSFEAAHITLTRGIFLGAGSQVTDQLAARLAEVTDRAGETVPATGFAQAEFEVHKAGGS